MQLRSFAFSHIGRVRPENEDSFLCDDDRQLYAVADGIGGLPAGAQASQKAIAVLTQLITPVPPPKNPETEKAGPIPSLFREGGKSLTVSFNALEPENRS